MESIIFGKNRHFFGGLEPSNMLLLKAINNNGVIEITAELPSDTVVDGQTLCSVAGAIIRRKIGSYPEDEFDGELVVDVKESGTYVDSDANPEDSVCYAAFPYSDQGVYNRSTVRSRATIVHTPDEQPSYIFGYDLDLSDPDPSTRVTYPDDVDNYGYTPAGMNYSTDDFEYGDWPSVSGVGFIPRPCMLAFDGTVAEYLDPYDYSLTEDGLTSSVSDYNFEGNAMMEWPKIYTKRWEENGIYHFRCSDVKVDDDYECWCNYDKNNNEIDHFYTAIYAGDNGNDTKSRSISDNSMQPGHLNSLSTAIQRAVENGVDWNVETLSDRLLINDLLVMMSKTTDSQTAFGSGLTDLNVHYNGSMNTKGMFYGSKSGSKAVKVFGMENWWGKYPRYVVGWITDNGVSKIKMTSGTKDGTTVNEYNATGDGYLTIGTVQSASNGLYINQCLTKEFGRFPCPVEGGSSSTYECDIYVCNTTVGLGYVMIGSSKNEYYSYGPFATWIQAIGSGIGYVGISCKPQAT